MTGRRPEAERQVRGRWEAGGRQVGGRWEAGGRQAGGRWEAGGRLGERLSSTGRGKKLRSMTEAEPDRHSKR